MSRSLIVALIGACSLASCKIEETPPEYFDHRDQVVMEREAAVVDEIEARMRAFTNALARGDGGDATTALAPAAGARDQIAAVLESVTSGEPRPATLREVHISTGADATVAWFNAAVEIPEAESEARAHLRVTGVYLRAGGEWELVQVHLSHPLIEPPLSSTPSNQVEEDSVGGG
ncbi:MAG TPA: nuclear transport factor 2 family protein [Longimicrobiaceae bacterium]|nr:nuclear transport factor 2 family protein [Longimicrobiaceae bacterium]